VADRIGWAVLDALVWLAIAGPWLALAAGVLALGALLGASWQWRRRDGLRDNRAAVAKLTIRVADLESMPGGAEAHRLSCQVFDARLAAMQDRAALAAANHRAGHAAARADSLAQKVTDLQHQLAAANDRARLAALEATTEWEVDPR
jgi:hypothetical protein